MQLKYECDSKSRKYTERYIRATKVGFCRLMLTGMQNALQASSSSSNQIGRASCQNSAPEPCTM